MIWIIALIYIAGFGFARALSLGHFWIGLIVFIISPILMLIALGMALAEVYLK